MNKKIKRMISNNRSEINAQQIGIWINDRIKRVRRSRDLGTR